MKKAWRQIIIFGMLTGVILLTGCNNSQSGGGAATGSRAEEPVAESAVRAETEEKTENSVTIVRIANAGMPKPYSYYDDNDEITGFDIELIRAVFDYLPDYDMELTLTEFPSTLAGLDSGRYDLVINCLKSTAEREEKYIFSDPYLDDLSVVIVPEDNTEINSLADCDGKTTVELVGTVGAERMEDYSERENAGITVNYSEADYSVMLQELNDGKYDFMFLNRLTYEQYNEEFHYNLRSFMLTPEERELYENGTNTQLTYIMASKTESGQEFIDAVNVALAALKENGTLNELAEKYFGSTEYIPQ